MTKMIGIIYTGETEQELFNEIKSSYEINYGYDLKIWVEPNFDNDFNKNILHGGYLNLGASLKRGMITQYHGVDITNTEIEFFKEKEKIVTLQEIADKFGVSKENIRIKDQLIRKEINK